jgi:hypothetical protein
MGPLPHVAPEAEPSAAKPAFVGMCDIYGDQHKRAADEHAYQTHRCTWRDMFTPKDGAEPDTEILEDIDAYLELFAAPILIDGKNLCPHCGHPFNGSLMDSFLGDGGFEWGLAHGEGHCRCCRWPARAYHFVKDRHGADLMTFRHWVLAYRPLSPEEISAADAPADTSEAHVKAPGKPSDNPLGQQEEV